VPLTTVHQPIEKIGATAINKLLAIIEGKRTETRSILQPHLVIRESCGAKTKKKALATHATPLTSTGSEK